MSRNNFPSKGLVDSIKSTTFAPTRTRQASPRCSNVRVVLFLYDEQQNPIPETIRQCARPGQTATVATLPWCDADRRGGVECDKGQVPVITDAPIRSVLNVQMSSPEAIEWPDLDVDLEVESLQHPERYPLVIKRNALDFAGV